MKNSLLMLLAVVTAVFFSSCSNEAAPLYENDGHDNSANLLAGKSAPLTVDLQHVYAHLEDSGGGMPVDDATELYNKQQGAHAAIMAPDGHHVTLGEWNMMSGYANVECINTGTHAVMHLKGLIPNGVYTIWLPIFDESGSRIAFGPFGAIEGGANFNGFMANSKGNATISLIRRAGIMETVPAQEAQGSVPNCLGEVYEAHLAIAYHLDGAAQQPGPRSTWAVQGVFQIFGSQL